MAGKIILYKLKSRRFTGVIYVSYQNGRFGHLDCLDAELSGEQLLYLLRILPPHEDQLKDVSMGTMVATPVVPRSIQDKVKLFSAFYKNYRGVSYQAKMLEKANLKDVTVNEELLKVFFESPLVNYTLKNYIDRINITKDVARNGREGQKFPNRFDAQLYKTLTGEALVAYRKHLRDLGWVYQSRNNTWVEPG